MAKPIQTARQTYGKAVTTAAVAMWQAESVRAIGKRRLEPWEDQDDATKEKWCGLANAAMTALIDAGYNLQLPK